jgi:hypothetical protein
MKFTIYNLATGEKLASLPLTVPIGATIEAYQKAGLEVSWTWEVTNA